jgi:hypothetical protein
VNRLPSAVAAFSDAARPDRQAQRTARWVLAIFVLEVGLQRVAVPGSPVGILLPVVVVWAVLGITRGVVELDRRRLAVWCLVEAVTGIAMLVQMVVLPAPILSVNSWLLLTLVWLPAVTRFVDRRPETYLLALRKVVGVCLVLAVGCMIMMLTQFVGLHYVDWFAKLVPTPLQLAGFNFSYPIYYQSTIYRANAWIGLEPSCVSFQLGIGLLCAVLVRARWWVLVAMVGGLAATFAASGFFLFVVGLIVLLVFPIRYALRRYLVPGAAIIIIISSTSFGENLWERSGELADSGSSTALRGVTGYTELLPEWSSNLLAAIVGRGPGSSQRIIDAIGIEGLIVPFPAKLLFDYGLFAGFVLAAFLLFCYVDGLSASLAFALFFSLWTVQSANQSVFVVPVIVLVTMWAPRITARLEDDWSPAVAARGPRILRNQEA